MSFICRYKSLQIRLFEFRVLWLYFNKALIFFSMCTYISMYLFHINIMIGLRQVLTQLLAGSKFMKHYSMKELFAQFQELVYYLAYEQWFCIKLAPVFLGISFMMRLFGIELALFTHKVLFRLFVGCCSINPVFLLISVCISLVLYMALSFKASYSLVIWLMQFKRIFLLWLILDLLMQLYFMHQ